MARGVFALGFGLEIRLHIGAEMARAREDALAGRKARRLELLGWAREAKAWIIEDDYASEFRYGGRALASLQGLDDSARVIYVGTLNKALFPGLRIGYAVVPIELVRTFTAARSVLDIHSPLFEQAVLAEFMIAGYFERHLRRMAASPAQ